MLPIRITFLGTSGSTPTRDRNLPSVSLEYDGSVYLFDCGEGTQRQMMHYSINPYKIKAIFITHMHGDHVIGVAGLIRTLALNKRTDPLEIYVPEKEEYKLKPLIDFDKALIGYRIIVKSVRSGIVLRGKGFSVGAFRLIHSIPTYGFVFKEDDKLRFIKDKCKRLGLKGAMYSKIQKEKRIKIGNRTISLKDVTTRQPGRKVVYAADTRPAKTTINASKDADVLIHEATYADNFRKLAKERLHSTSFECAQIAKRANAKKLVIFHMSARYRDAEPVLKDARKGFKNTVLANDGLKINL